MRHGQILEHLKSKLVPGQVYRRTDFEANTSNVDRHLATMVAAGVLKKLAHGLYAAPKSTSFGEAPPDERSLIQSFLKDDHFVVYSFNNFNALSLGTTQLYNQTFVFNRKRVGTFKLGWRTYTFHRWREAPKKLTVEFLVVELMNRLNQLAENRDEVVWQLKRKLREFNLKRLKYNLDHYGTVFSQKLFSELMTESA